MARFRGAVSLIRSVLTIVITCFAFCAISLGQITSVTTTQAPPMPGKGHDYIHLLSETVDPASGGVNFRIGLPTPGGRVLNIPVALSYSSNGIYQPSEPTAVAAPILGTPASILGRGPGWTYAFPQLTYHATEYLFQTIFGDGSSGPLYSCDATFGYTFQDASGAQHTIPIGIQSQYASQSSQVDCGNAGAVTPGTGHLSGTDGHYAGSTADTDNVMMGNSPVTITGADGTVYKFVGASDSQLAPGYVGQQSTWGEVFWSYPATIEDRNGNIINVSGQGTSLSITDSAGHTAVSASSYNTSTKTSTISVSGITAPIQVQWQSISTTFHTGWTLLNPPPSQAGYSCMTPSGSDGSGEQTVINSITLPTVPPTTFQFQYNNPYGLPSKIIYPNGGYIRYDWAENQSAELYVGDGWSTGNTNTGVQPVSNACYFVYGVPAVQHRYVSYDGINTAEEQDFNYSTQWSSSSLGIWTNKQTTVLNKDCQRSTSCTTAPSFQTTYNYVPVPVIIPPGTPSPMLAGNQAAVEGSVIHQNFDGSLLRTDSKGWVDQYSLGCEEETLDSGQTSGTWYLYDAHGQVTSTKMYDFGAVSSACSQQTVHTPPSGTPTRETVTAYQPFANTPIGSTIYDLPSSIKIYGNGILSAETDYSYDGNPLSSVAAIQHDPQFGTSLTTRGNATTIKKLCLQSCPATSTNFVYDIAGQIASSTDANGNVTQYSYSDSNNTDSNLTQITYPQTNGVSHVKHFSYDFATGQLTSTTDENGNITSYQYNDPLARLTRVISPDGGQTTVTYNDGAYNPSQNLPNVTTTKKINSTLNVVSVIASDGMGHSVRAIVNSDPEGADITDTTYDGQGLKYTVSNPYRTTSDPTYGITHFTYDALGRETQTLDSDGSSATTTYSGNLTVITDEAGNQRRSATDGLGRLIEVDEPGQSGTPATPAKGSFTVFGSEQSAQVGSPVAGTGSVTLSGSLQSWQTQTAPATNSSGNVTISGTLQSKQVQTQFAASGTSSYSVSGSGDNTRSIDPCFPHGSCPQTIPNNGTVSLTVDGFTSSASYGPGSTASRLQATIESGFNSPSSPVTVSGGVIRAKAQGASTNYSFSSSATWNTSTCPDGNPCFGFSPFTISPTSGTLIGGKDNAFTTVYDSGTTTITINGQPISYSWSGSGTTPTSIAAGLAAAVNSSSSYATASSSGATVFLTSRTTGASVNYSLSSGSTFDSGHFSGPSFGTSNSGASMTGGVNAQFTTNYDSGSTSITANGHATSYSWSGSSTTSSSIASGIASAINADGSASVNASASGAVVSLTSRTTGASTNYSLSSSSSSSHSSFTATASGSTLTGGANAPVTFDSGTVTITINGTPASVSYNSSSTSASVASSLASAISSALVTSSVTGSTDNLTTVQTGSASNYAISGNSSTSQPGTFSSPSFSVSLSGFNLTGGADGNSNGGVLSMNTPAVTLYTYNALNNLTNATQEGPSGTPSSLWRNRNFTYDSLGRLTLASNPESGNITYAYDANGNVASRTDARGISTTYHYDALNRIKEKDYSDGTSSVFFAYDTPSSWGATQTNIIGKLEEEWTGTSCCGTTAEIFSYDPMGRVLLNTQYTPNMGYLPVNYTYDLFGHLTSATNGKGVTINYAYDAAERPNSVTSSLVDAQHPATLATVDSAEGYFPTGALHKLTLGNGLTETATFTNRLQPCRMNVNSSGAILNACTDALSGTVLDLSYNFNPGTDNGNLMNMIASGSQAFNRSYAYDGLNRLHSLNSTGTGGSFSWTYDAWGNRLAQTLTAGTGFNWSSSVAANNRLSDGPYTYDASGNLLTDGNHTYAYDAENRIKTVDGGSVSYLYNAEGDRVEKTVSGGWTDFVHDLSGHHVTEVYATGWGPGYVYLGGKLLAEYKNGTTYFVNSDNLGSTRLMTQMDKSIYDSLDYQPFGEQIAGDTGTTHKFTGKERDGESGLDYFGARYYGSSLGRFLTPDWASRPDPVPYADFGNPQSLNLYDYVKNNPITMTDPTGHCDVDQEHHGKFWCVLHKLGFIYTDKEAAEAEHERANMIRNGLSQRHIQANGQTIDWDKLSDQEVFAVAGKYYEALLSGDVATSGLGVASSVIQFLDITKPGSVRNIQTDVSPQDFGTELEANGYTKSVSADGKAINYTKGDHIYSVYQNAKSTGGPTAQLTVKGDIVAKIRLK